MSETPKTCFLASRLIFIFSGLGKGRGGSGRYRGGGGGSGDPTENIITIVIDSVTALAILVLCCDCPKSCIRCVRGKPLEIPCVMVFCADSEYFLRRRGTALSERFCDYCWFSHAQAHMQL